uniref:Uncharacterized protein n=1 Tax=Molossus molossus TaxID=27622 RepID=A0A7J8JWT4_MOLMO|nr:hypothetical protein HJG59_007869 [Molossus molossus]
MARPPRGVSTGAVIHSRLQPKAEYGFFFTNKSKADVDWIFPNTPHLLTRGKLQPLEVLSSASVPTVIVLMEMVWPPHPVRSLLEHATEEKGFVFSLTGVFKLVDMICRESHSATVSFTDRLSY